MGANIITYIWPSLNFTPEFFLVCSYTSHSTLQEHLRSSILSFFFSFIKLDILPDFLLKYISRIRKFCSPWVLKIFPACRLFVCKRNNLPFSFKLTKNFIYFLYFKISYLIFVRFFSFSFPIWFKKKYLSASFFPILSSFSPLSSFFLLFSFSFFLLSLYRCSFSPDCIPSLIYFHS